MEKPSWMNSGVRTLQSELPQKNPQSAPCHPWNSAAIAGHPRNILFQQLTLVSWIQEWSCSSRADPRKLLAGAAGRCRPCCPSVQLCTASGAPAKSVAKLCSANKVGLKSPKLSCGKMSNTYWKETPFWAGGGKCLCRRQCYSQANLGLGSQEHLPEPCGCIGYRYRYI